LSGRFLCSSGGTDFDCASTAFDSCLTHGVRAAEGAAAAEEQLALAGFLSCFEGPFANREVQTNATRRRPCFDAHFDTPAATSWDTVQTCATTPAVVDPIMSALNRTRAPMYARLGPNPGYFPHIFVDGEHQWNNSWTSLLRTLCGRLSPAPPACAAWPFAVTFHLATTTAVSAEAIQRRAQPFSDAVLEAANLAASRALFPWNWNTTDEPGQVPGAPSYVNVRAAAGGKLVSLTPLPLPTASPTLAVVVSFEALAALEPPLARSLASAARDAAAPIVEAMLRANGFAVEGGSVTAIRNEACGQPGQCA